MVNMALVANLLLYILKEVYIEREHDYNTYLVKYLLELESS